MIKKLLIANRGEIACRIIRTARRMGIKCVAVYSDADRNAIHVRMADEAVHIGASPVGESYLRDEAIIQAALDSNADAIHPGYGFLSENPDFVEIVEKAGLIFVGPSASAIRAMGLKDAAKKLMQEAVVPVVPGFHGENQDAEFLAQEAEKIGYPVLIKARAGGGGKGMRKVEQPEDFAAALEGAVREGEASFGDGHVLIEKYIAAPRHIEIQVFGDNHGNVVHLFERDCSLQRRHQKVIEEAPAPGMSDEMRKAMGDAAVKAAQAIDYSGAGTVEFIVDGSDGLKPDRFWFMEMNTRLQVEHPVTEAITGQDLVEWQLRVASDEYLPMFQDELKIEGHAFEARLYAEDVPKGFLPATGTLHHVKFSNLARNDTGVESGSIISPYYDPMIAKVITHGETREQALMKLNEALRETQIAGTITNLAFLVALTEHTGFANGKVDTGLIERDGQELSKPAELPDEMIALAAKRFQDLPAHPLESADINSKDPFDSLSGFSIWEAPAWTQKLSNSDGKYQVKIRRHGKIWQCKVKHGDDRFGKWFTDIECSSMPLAPEVFLNGHKITVFGSTGTWGFTRPDLLMNKAGNIDVGNSIIAPMPGLVKAVYVGEGDRVREGDALIILEAMKMEHTLTAPRNGKIKEVNVAVNDQVEDSLVLLELEQDDV